MRQLLCVLCASVLLVGVSSEAQEQRGSITGTVKSAAGNPLPGATVEARGPSLVGVATTETDAEGVYRFPALAPGRYEVTATIQFFKTAKTGNIDLELGQTLKVDLTLEFDPAALPWERQKADRGSPAPAPELRRAAGRGDKELVARLLASGASDKEKTEALLWAVMVSPMNREIVEMLVASGADVQAKQNQGVSTLHFAVMQGQKEIAELLLARGLDVNVADDNANTPLHIAASQGNTKMVALLLAKGANVNAKTNMEGDEGETDDYVGDTPLHLAALNERKWRAITPELRKKYTSIGAGALVDTAALLLANGADVNANNDKGETPLRLATSKEMKALLKKYGAK